MNVCIPVEADLGIRSPICGHFGSAPFFMMIDTESLACHALENANQHHEHGQCRPLAAIQGQQVDALIVGGIGGGALAKLRMAGIRVFRAEHATVEEAVAALKGAGLTEVAPADACQHHGGGGPQGHGPHGHGPHGHGGL